MPIDIRALRADQGGNPDAFREYQRKRFRPVEWVDETLALDTIWRDATTRLNHLKRDANKIQTDKITPKIKAKENCDAEKAEKKALEAEVTVSQRWRPQAKYD